MKKIFSLNACAFFAFLFFISCRASVEDNGQQGSIANMVTKGNWSVNLYLDANLDQTNDFAGYRFVFYENGQLTATVNGIVTEGIWSENVYTTRVLLNFNTTDPVLSKINDEWLISSQRNNELKFNSNTNPTQVEVLGIVQQ